MALLILALLQRIFLMSSLMLLLVWLIFFMVLIKLLPILGTISGKTVKLDRKSGSAGMPRSEERFSRNAETDLVCRLLLEKKKIEYQAGGHTVTVGSDGDDVLLGYISGHWLTVGLSSDPADDRGCEG